MKPDAWFALYDKTWPLMQQWLADKPINDMLASVSARGKKPFSYDVFVEYQGRGFYQMMDELRIEACVSDEKRAREAWNKLWMIMQSIWNEAPDHPIVHTLPGWQDFCDLLSEHPYFSGDDE